MPKKITTKTFIERAKKIHKNKYDYLKVSYYKSNIKVEIGCPIHGYFFQNPASHLSGAGCMKCNLERVQILNIVPEKEFIQRSKIIHNNKYDYSKLNYVKGRIKVEIICPIHGSFFQLPNDHLNGRGCRRCGSLKSGGKLSTEKFIERANKTHENKYDYSKVNYYGINKKVEIICSIHGSFFQTPHNHISRKSGCPGCALKEESKLENIIKDKFKDWVIFRHKKTFSEVHNRFRYFDFYLIKGEERVIIEYDGEQHYRPIRWNYKILKERANTIFEKQKETDKLDALFCEKNNIKLYRISYIDDMKKFVEKIKGQGNRRI